MSRYPFTSIPVVENTISLTAETMTDSGWISDGKDMGVKTRLTKSGTLVGERTLPFRVMDLTRIPAVNEEEDISQMLVTLTTSAAVSQANFKSDNLVMQGLSGVLNGLSGPIDSSVFKMIITPTNDPTVFNALIWAGYDSLELEDVDYVDGIAFETDYLNQKLEVGVPGVNDLANMANGTYNPSQTLQQSASKVTSADAELQLQLTGYYEAEIRYNLEQREVGDLYHRRRLYCRRGYGDRLHGQCLCGPCACHRFFRCGRRHSAGLPDRCTVQPAGQQHLE